MKASLLCVFALTLCISSSTANANGPAATSTTQLTAQLFEPGKDLLAVKLSVDAMVDPTTNAGAVKVAVDQMASDIRAMIKPDANSAAKLAAMRHYLYESGPWNRAQPFSYDRDDPLGQKPANRLLQHYLTTRRGNCITMPMLMMFVGQRLGLRMTLAEAPLHLFIKYTDDAGKTWNLEATSGGGFTRDLWYRQKLPMSDKAVANGVYLRALTHEEAAAVIASVVVEDYIAKGQFENAIAASDMILSHYPNFAYMLVKRGNAYAGLLHRELAGKYAMRNDIPQGLRMQADEWYRQNLLAFAKAEALGWTPKDGDIE